MKLRDNNQKRQFSNVFLLFVILLLTLPLFITFQDLITRILDLTKISWLIQKYIIPIEVKYVISVLRILRIEAIGDDKLIVLTNNTREVFRAQIIWSCIGWQSVVLLLVTFLTGISRKYTLVSRIETIIIGIIATFWINIVRIVIIYLLGYFFGNYISLIFHNFIGTIMIIAWLFFFWWFSYKFILEERQSTIHDEGRAVKV